MQEFRTGATKQNMEVTHAREEVKKLQKMLGDSRGRLADLEARVNFDVVYVKNVFPESQTPRLKLLFFFKNNCGEVFQIP